MPAGNVRVIRDNRPLLKAALRTASAQATADEAALIVVDAKAHVAVRTGETRDSIEAERAGPARWRITVGGAGFWLEFGTVKMAAQPFFLPALQRARLRLLQRIADNFRSLKR